MKVAVIGANGQLGSDFVKAFNNKGYEVKELTHSDIEVEKIDSVNRVLKAIKPQIIINTSAFHNVPECEKNPIKSFEVNSIGPRNLSIISKELDAILVHTSTDYVFDGIKNSPYIEEDIAIPLNVYGNTKLSGEKFVQSINDKNYILRVSGLYGVNPCRVKGYNFVTLMLKLAKERDELRVVDDEKLTPTFTENIANQMVLMIEKDAEYGIYHITDENSCTWYEFAKEIFNFSGVKVKLNKALPGEFKTEVNRPQYSVLENKKLKSQNINIMKDWRESLKNYISQIL